MKKTVKKLRITPDTIRSLTTAQLAEPRGGCETGSLTTDRRLTLACAALLAVAMCR